MIEQHGGQIDCTTAPGQGATFTIRLPLAERGRRAAGRCGRIPLDRGNVGALTFAVSRGRRAGCKSDEDPLQESDQ